MSITGTEIERKFLFKDSASVVDGKPVIPEDSVLAGIKGKHMLQGYFTVDGGASAKLEGLPGERSLTITRRDVGRHLTPVVIPLSDDEFDELWAFSSNEYLKIAAGFEARIRDTEGKGKVTLKADKGVPQKQGDALDRQEFEVKVSPDVLQALLYANAAPVRGTVEKIRYEVPIGNGLVAEVDLFLDRDRKTVEVEVPTAGTPIPELPWIGKELFGKEHSNAALALETESGLTDNSNGGQLIG